MYKFILLTTLTALYSFQLSSAEIVNLDLSEGAIAITPAGYSQGTTSAEGYFEYEISTSSPTANSLTVEGGSEDSPVVITLKDVNIDKNLLTGDYLNAEAPIKVKPDYTTFILEGTTELKSIDAYPGLALEGDANLYIKGDGTLKAYGSEKEGNQYTYRCGAGIGADETSSLTRPTGHLHIFSGNVYAYSNGGGYGFGTGAGNVYNGGIYGGSVSLHGGSAHFFGGYHPHDNYVTEGIGSRHQGVQLYIGGGELEAILQSNTKPSDAEGSAITGNSIDGFSPYSIVKLPGMLNQKECGVSTNFAGTLYYWTYENQTFEDFIDGKVLLQGKSKDSYFFKIYGLGLFEKGDKTELRAESQDSYLIFDHWSFSSTENPVDYIVDKSETIEAIFKLDPQKVWTMSAIDSREGECSASSFNCPGLPFNYDTIEIPSTFEIDGTIYTVTELGTQDKDISFYYDASNLTLVIPSTIKSIGASTFGNLHGDMSMMDGGFRKVICNALVPPALFNGDELTGVSANCELVVPDIALDAYHNDPVWGKAFANISTMECDGYAYIDLTEGNVTISETGYSIGENFREWTGPYILKTSSPTSNEITISGGDESTPISITLYDIDIDRWTATGNGLNIPSGYVDMTLIGENNIRGGHDGAGIWLPAESTLHIHGDGKLIAKAGSTNAGAWLAGAGIGGGKESASVGTLIIDSGSVYGYGILGSAGFGSASVWKYTVTSAPLHGVLILNGGDAHFFGSADSKYNTVVIPEGIGCAGNVPTVVFHNGGTLEATLREGTPVVTDGLHYEQQIQPGLSPNQTFNLVNHLGMAECTATTDELGNLVYWLADGQSRRDVIGFDYVLELYTTLSIYGSVSGAGFYNDGDTAEVTFTWTQGNHDFEAWSDGSTDNPYIYTITGDTKLTAMLVPNELRAWRFEKETDSETGETNCAAIRFDGAGFDIDVLEIPSTFEIDGIEYSTTQLGDNRMGEFYIDLAYQLQNLILPKSITKVSRQLGFVKTDVFTCLATTPPAIIKDMHSFGDEKLSFYDLPDDAVLHVPFGTSALYRAAEGWKQFSAIEELRPEEETWIATNHTDTECHIHGYDHPETFSSSSLTVPNVFSIDGIPYTVTTLGHPQTGEINLNITYAVEVFTLPATITQVSPFLFGIPSTQAAIALSDDDESDSTLDAPKGLNNLKYVYCNAINPPVLTDVEGYDSFAQIPAGATLIVPKDSIEKYKSAPGWKDFTIRTDETTAIESAECADIDCLPEIYNLQGVKIDSSLESLAPGIYLIRQGDTIRKIIVR